MMCLMDFIRESNRIEGLDIRPGDFEAHEKFLAREVTVESLEDFVAEIADAYLRTMDSMNVRVGQHVAPRGGPGIRVALDAVLTISDAYQQHCAYLTLHPFMDGNGRSARALWLHRRGGKVPQIGFLQSFYYQALGHADGR